MAVDHDVVVCVCCVHDYEDIVQQEQSCGHTADTPISERKKCRLVRIVQQVQKDLQAVWKLLHPGRDMENIKAQTIAEEFMRSHVPGATIDKTATGAVGKALDLEAKLLPLAAERVKEATEAAFAVGNAVSGEAAVAIEQSEPLITLCENFVTSWAKDGPEVAKDALLSALKEGGEGSVAGGASAKGQRGEKFEHTQNPIRDGTISSTRVLSHTFFSTVD